MRRFSSSSEASLVVSISRVDEHDLEGIMISSRTRIPVSLDSLHLFGRVSNVIAIPRHV